MKRIILGLIFISLSMSAQTSIKSFSKAKKILYKKIYNTSDLKYGFYSNCSYEWKKIRKPNGKQLWKQVVNKDSCNYTPRTKSRRANFIEAEHIVPAHAFGHSFLSWREGDDRCVYKSGKKKGKHYKGRKCATLVSKKFKLMQADLYNLVPAIGELNSDRSNYTFTVLPGEPRKYGKVDFEVDFKHRKVEPPEYSKGRIARTYFYMQKEYGLKISKKQMKLFRIWDNKYPMTDKEKMINIKIHEIQGNEFIS